MRSISHERVIEAARTLGLDPKHVKSLRIGRDCVEVVRTVLDKSGKPKYDYNTNRHEVETIKYPVVD